MFIARKCSATGLWMYTAEASENDGALWISKMRRAAAFGKTHACSSAAISGKIVVEPALQIP